MSTLNKISARLMEGPPLLDYLSASSEVQIAAVIGATVIVVALLIFIRTW